MTDDPMLYEQEESKMPSSVGLKKGAGDDITIYYVEGSVEVTKGSAFTRLSRKIVPEIVIDNEEDLRCYKLGKSIRDHFEKGN